MNLIFRILVAIYAFISTVVWGIVMISPFGSKKIMSVVLDYLNITFYQSNKYDIAVFVIALIFFALNIVILSSGITMRKTTKYLCRETETGVVRISSNSIENIALAMSKRFQGVKDAKAKVAFADDSVEIALRISALTDTNVPSLCKSIQERVKEAVESSMEIKVTNVNVTVDGVVAASE